MRCEAKTIRLQTDADYAKAPVALSGARQVGLCRSPTCGPQIVDISCLGPNVPRSNLAGPAQVSVQDPSTAILLNRS